MELFTVAFFGHRYIDNLFKLEEILDRHIYKLLSEKEYVTFLIGRNGDFDQCVASTVHKVKKNYRDDNSELILVLPYETQEYLNNVDGFENYYDEIIFSHKASIAYPKAAIQIRNREMVDRANLIISFIEKNFGGAYKTIEYAKKQNKAIINIAEGLKNQLTYQG